MSYDFRTAIILIANDSINALDKDVLERAIMRLCHIACKEQREADLCTISSVPEGEFEAVRNSPLVIENT